MHRTAGKHFEPGAGEYRVGGRRNWVRKGGAIWTADSPRMLFDLFETFPAGSSLLDRLRGGARRAARPTWEEGWATEARPVLLSQ